MTQLPEEVMKMANDMKAVKVLTTISADGVLHSIRVGSMVAPAPNMMAVGAILMKTSAKNMEDMKKKNQTVAILLGSEMNSYLIMAKVKDTQKAGPLFDKMNENLKAIGLQAGAVWVFEPTGVWNQGATYEAGKKIA